MLVGLLDVSAPDLHLVAEDILRYPLGKAANNFRPLVVLQQVAEHACAKTNDGGTSAEGVHGVRIGVDGLLAFLLQPTFDDGIHLRTGDRSFLGIELPCPADDLGFLCLSIRSERGDLGERGVGQLRKAHTCDETVFGIAEETMEEGGEKLFDEYRVMGPEQDEIYI